MKYNLTVTRKSNPNELPDIFINGVPAGIIECIEYLFEMMEELESRVENE